MFIRFLQNVINLKLSSSVKYLRIAEVLAGYEQNQLALKRHGAEVNAGVLYDRIVSLLIRKVMKIGTITVLEPQSL